MKTLQVKVKTEYGNRRRYLGSDPLGLAVKALTGKPTLHDSHVKALEEMGFSIEEI